MLRKWARSILHARGTPEAVALGVAIGVFVAMTPTMGVQMIIAAFIATLVGASRVPAMVMVYISNPLTFVPLYGLCYKVGAIMLRHGLGLATPSGSAVRAEFAVFAQRGFFGTIVGVLQLSRRIALPLWTGSILLGLLGGLICYPIALRLVKGHRLVKAQKRARRMARQSPPADDSSPPEAE